METGGDSYFQEAIEMNPSNPLQGEKTAPNGENVLMMADNEAPTDPTEISMPNENGDSIGVEREAEEILDATVEKVVEENEAVNKGKVNEVNGEVEDETVHEERDEAILKSADNIESGKDEVSKEGSDEVEKAINEQELKYWNAVKENPQDFTSWTYLLQFVEQENKLDTAKEAFEAFLKRYPFCYGYWKKYADVEKKNGDLKQASEVFENGVEAIPLSVDLWVHYLNFTSNSTKGHPESAATMRSLFERAISAAGEEFRSDKLWDAYIEWEKSQQQLPRVTALYDRVLTVPTQNYRKQWEKFQEHVNSNPLPEVLGAEDLLKLKAELGAAPPGFTFESDEELPEVNAAQENESMLEKTAEAANPEASAIRKKVIALRKGLHDANEAEVNKRWSFEDAIKRPYFHVKPLERVQLKNWREYLDFEIGTGNHRRVVILFERCVIACALYEDFWQRFASYMDVHDCVEGCQQVYERACTVHLPFKPHIHLAWAVFEEKHGNIEKARNILTNLEEVCPGLTFVKLQRANLERRCKEIANACAIYEVAISENANKDLESFYAIRYARFLFKIAKDVNKAKDVLLAAVKKDQENKRLYLQLLDLELSMSDVDEEKVEEVFDMVKNSTLPEDVKEGFSQRRLEFLQDFSNSVVKVTKAQEAHNKIYKSKSTHSVGRKRSQDDGLESNSKMVKTDSNHDVQTNAGAYDTTTDYSAAYAASNAYTYSNPQWLNYQAAHPGYNYATWYQQYGQAYQPTQ